MDIERKMGATLVEKGVRFRLWAPHAEQVFVRGSYNAWQEDGIPLEKEDNGRWATTVPDAQVGDTYAFRLVTSSGVLERVDPYARMMTQSDGHSQIINPSDFDWEEDDFQLPPWHELVIYELHLGTFARPSEEQIGTFEAAIEKLSYLQELGINAIEVMPLAEFPGDLSWGYNPAHPFAIEEAYGGPSGLKNFVKAAHAHGIGVLVDVVYNHFGPSDLDLWRFDGWSENEFGGIYFYNDQRAATPWGDTRPDYGREEVRQYIYDNVRMWSDEYRVDGLRWDATNYIRNSGGLENPEEELPDGWSLMGWINAEMQSHKPGFLVIAEDLQENAALTERAENGGAEFGSQWSAAFVHPLRQALIAQDDERRNLAAVAAALKQRFGTDMSRRVIYTESHDEVANGKARVPYEVAPDDPEGYFAKKRATLGSGLVLTAPGIPMLFQGQEFLEDEWFRDTDPLDWEKRGRLDGIVQLHRDLIQLRRTHPALLGHEIEITHVNQADKLLAFRRFATDTKREEALLVVANFSASSQTGYRLGFPAAGHWELSFNSDASLYDEDFDDVGSERVETEDEAYDGCAVSGKISIGGYSLQVFQFAVE